MSSPTAAPALRDQFLAALDSNNGDKARQLANYLVSCTNQLPSLTCADLGLPFGSRYSHAAVRVLEGGPIGPASVDLNELAALAKGTTR